MQNLGGLLKPKGEVMKYAVDYAPVGDSQVLAWTDGEEPKGISLTSGKDTPTSSGIFGFQKSKKSKLASSMKTVDFLAGLGADDLIYTELGGQNDKFCLAASRTGAKLLRLPTWIIHDEQKRQRTEEGKSGDGVETSVSILHRTVCNHPEQFYSFREIEDTRYLEIRLLSRMFLTVQTKIRMATANRLRHLQQDLNYFGGLKGLPEIRQGIDAVVETLPADEQVEIDLDTKEGVAVKFYKTLERRLKSAMESILDELPLYKAVFADIPGCGAGIAGYMISQIQDIRRFPNFPKFKAFAGYHMVRNNGGWKVPKPTKGQRANWDHILKQAVYFFASSIDKQGLDNPWKKQLEERYLYEIGKLLAKTREEGKPIPADMTTGSFLEFVAGVRKIAAEEGKIPTLPEPYKGIPAWARRRALRWLGQVFLGYVWSQWRKFEGVSEPKPYDPILPEALKE